MASWSDFHTDPRKSYYLFLRQEYQHPAWVAHARVKHIDSMIAELQAPSGSFGWTWLTASLLRSIEALTRRLWAQRDRGRWMLKRGMQ